MYQRILRDPLMFPADMSPDARGVMTGLLQREPDRRLGANGADEIKRHPFFKDVNFDDVLNKRIPPPYFPTIVRPPPACAAALLTRAVHRTEARTRATSTRSSRASSPRSRLCTASSRAATRPSSTASPGCVAWLLRAMCFADTRAQVASWADV